jgi:hypothetical protein
MMMTGSPGRRAFTLVGQGADDIAGVGEAAHGELLACKGLLQDEADRLIVVDDPDVFHASASAFVKARG